MDDDDYCSMDDKSHVMKYHEVVPVDMSQYCFNVIDIKQEPVEYEDSPEEDITVKLPQRADTGVSESQQVLEEDRGRSCLQLHNTTSETLDGEQRNEWTDAELQSTMNDSEDEDIKPDIVSLRNAVSGLYAIDEVMSLSIDEAVKRETDEPACDDDSIEQLNQSVGPTLGKSKGMRKSYGHRKSYECYICHQTFTHSSSLARHTMMHSGIRRYTCETCNKSFAQPGHLDIHKRTHTGERPYKCDDCNKGFIDSSHLVRHKRVHTGERCFTCSICNKSFRQLGTLNIHMRKHTGFKPFTCDVCDKGFIDVSHLVIHKRNHTGERPFVCETCDKGFMNTSHLNRHKRLHLDESTPTCDVCGKTFEKRTSLTMHKRIHSSTKSGKSKPSSSTDHPARLSVSSASSQTVRNNNRAKSATPTTAVESTLGSLLSHSVKTEPNYVYANDARRSAIPVTAATPPLPPFVCPIMPFAPAFPAIRLPLIDIRSALQLSEFSKLVQRRDVAK